jgi:hypothetical protein
MTTPMRPVPDGVLAWINRRWWLRWGDALVAWALLWGGGVLLLGPGLAQASAVVALAAVVAGGWVPAVRVRWRPISGWVGLHLSRDLRPGDRAWYVAREASLVVVTARRGVRVVIARSDLVEDEVITVRRTRVFLLAAEAPAGGARGAR